MQLLNIENLFSILMLLINLEKVATVMACNMEALL